MLQGDAEEVENWLDEASGHPPVPQSSNGKKPPADHRVSPPSGQRRAAALVRALRESWARMVFAPGRPCASAASAGVAIFSDRLAGSEEPVDPSLKRITELW